MTSLLLTFRRFLVAVAFSSQAESNYTALLTAEKSYEADLERFDGGMEHLASMRKCVEGDDGKYTYTVCGFEKVEQREDGSRATTLGKYTSHEGEVVQGAKRRYFPYNFSFARSEERSA